MNQEKTYNMNINHSFVILIVAYIASAVAIYAKFDTSETAFALLLGASIAACVSAGFVLLTGKGQ